MPVQRGRTRLHTAARAVPREQQHGERAAEQRRTEGRRARDPDVPLLAGGADQRRQRTLRVDGARAEPPGIGSELRQRDRHQHEQHAARGSDSPSRSVARRSLAGCAQYAAAIAIANQVSGSSRKPL